MNSIGYTKEDMQQFAAKIAPQCCGYYGIVYIAIPIPVAVCAICGKHYYLPVLVSLEDGAGDDYQ